LKTLLFIKELDEEDTPPGVHAFLLPNEFCFTACALIVIRPCTKKVNSREQVINPAPGTIEITKNQTIFR